MGSDTGQRVLVLRSTLHKIRYKAGTGLMVDNIMPVIDEGCMEECMKKLVGKRDVLCFMKAKVSVGMM
jgi:hypothetical protein